MTLLPKPFPLVPRFALTNPKSIPVPDATRKKTTDDENKWKSVKRHLCKNRSNEDRGDILGRGAPGTRHGLRY